MDKKYTGLYAEAFYRDAWCLREWIEYGERTDVEIDEEVHTLADDYGIPYADIWDYLAE